MELSIDAGTKGLLGVLGAIKSSIHFLAKRKAAELAVLKLVRNKLEEHVWRSCSLISIKIAVRSETVAQEATRPPGRATAVPSF